MRRFYCSFLFLLVVATGASAAKSFRTESFDGSVRTLQVRLSGDPLAPPVALLGHDEGIVISFDMLADDPEYLYYRVVMQRRLDTFWPFRCGIYRRLQRTSCR